MTEDFESLPWHDAILQEILIDRRLSGESDEIRLGVRWSEGEETTLVFSDCYGLSAKMNFGIIAEEQISQAHIASDDPKLISIRDKWRALGIQLDNLTCYEIETASTASLIQIYAKRFKMINSAPQV